VTTRSGISRRRAAQTQDGSAEYAAKREELVRAAADVFREKGYRSTTLNDVAKLAGLDRATVYYYFGSKEELFREAVQGLLDANLVEAERLLRDKTALPRDKLRHLIEMLMLSYEAKYPYAYVYMQQDMHKVADESSSWAAAMVKQTHRFEKVVLTLIKEGTAKGDLRADVVPELAANALFGMLNWTHRWYRPGGRHDARQIAAAFAKVFLGGMVCG
jgi:TetR/AcrR family transcriptional regulator, cholesterol catabolism regulator